MKFGVEIKHSWTARKDLLDNYFGLLNEMDFLSSEFFSNLKGKALI